MCEKCTLITGKIHETQGSVEKDKKPSLATCKIAQGRKMCKGGENDSK